MVLLVVYGDFKGFYFVVFLVYGVFW